MRKPSPYLLPEQEPCPFWVVLYTLEYIEEARKRIEARGIAVPWEPGPMEIPKEPPRDNPS